MGKGLCAGWDLRSAGSTLEVDILRKGVAWNNGPKRVLVESICHRPVGFGLPIFSATLLYVLTFPFGILKAATGTSISNWVLCFNASITSFSVLIEFKSIRYHSVEQAIDLCRLKFCLVHGAKRAKISYLMTIVICRVANWSVLWL